jgi:hypothetical protein
MPDFYYDRLAAGWTEPSMTCKFSAYVTKHGSAVRALIRMIHCPSTVLEIFSARLCHTPATCIGPDKLPPNPASTLERGIWHHTHPFVDQLTRQLSVALSGLLKLYRVTAGVHLADIVIRLFFFFR